MYTEIRPSLGLKASRSHLPVLLILLLLLQYLRSKRLFRTDKYRTFAHYALQLLLTSRVHNRIKTLKSYSRMQTLHVTLSIPCS